MDVEKPNPFKDLPKISQRKLDFLVEQLKKEGVVMPRNKDVCRILRVSAAQATLYLKAWRVLNEL